MSGNSKRLIAFNYFGGKFTWIDQLYRHFPEHKHFVDVFGGSFVVSLNWHKPVIRTANEINANITNFFEVLRNSQEELLRLLALTPISKLEYENAYKQTDNKIENARRFYVRVRQSFFGLGMERKNKGWHMAKTQINCKGGETISKFLNGVNSLEMVAMELRKNFQITNYSYKDCIEKIDFNNAFFYCDPPYHLEARKSANDYAFEFSNVQHSELAELLNQIEGKAMISGYDCPAMNDLYRDWNKVIFPSKKNNIRSSLVQECIWMNYTPPNRQLNLLPSMPNN